ncbi:MAG: hypothetical protein Q9211_003693 [Gyalolechia sp. 1 TL-2023]
MCVIERFHVIHPSGFREPTQRLRHCPFGTPTTPCKDSRVVNVVDEVLDPAQKAPSPPHIQVIEPRTTDRQRSQEHKEKPKKIYDDLKVVFDFHIPFTSRRKKAKSRPKKDSEKAPKEDDPMAQPGFPRYFARPLEPQQLPPRVFYPSPGMRPWPPPRHPQDPSAVHAGAQVPPPISVNSSSSTDSSLSPKFPIREHRRPRPRSLSVNRDSEERDRIIQEQWRRERAEQVARAENAAREERERERLIAREVERRIERRRRHEERERQAQASARRRREDADRWLAIEAQEVELRREAGRRREEERQWRMQEERERLGRQRVAGIPRAPRHVAELHHHHHYYVERNSFEQQARDNLERRGDQVINEAIRARVRDDEFGYPDGGPRRRRTIGGAERRIYDDDRRRFGRRWF